MPQGTRLTFLAQPGPRCLTNPRGCTSCVIRDGMCTSTCHIVGAQSQLRNGETLWGSPLSMGCGCTPSPNTFMSHPPFKPTVGQLKSGPTTSHGQSVKAFCGNAWGGPLRSLWMIAGTAAISPLPRSPQHLLEALIRYSVTSVASWFIITRS